MTSDSSSALDYSRCCCPLVGYMVMTVHAKNSSTQTAGLAGAIKGLALHVLSNQGSYPVSLFGMSLIAGNLLLFAVGLSRFRLPAISPRIGSVCLWRTRPVRNDTLRRIFRNMVTVSTAQGVFQTVLFQELNTKRLMTCAIALVALGNIGGTFNVVDASEHGQKGSWNTPYPEVLTDLQQKRDSFRCTRFQVVTHDVVLASIASRYNNTTVVTVGADHWREQITGFTGCRAAIQTFRGSMNRDLVEQYGRLIAELPHRVGPRQDPGADRYAGFKRRFDPDIPDYYVTVTYFAPR